MTFRSADTGDIEALTALDRAANQAARGHLFAALEFPSDAADGADCFVWCCGACGTTPVARGLYEHLAWVLTGRTGRSVYPPYHPEVEYTLRDPRG